jgi:hypothetical protein
MFGMFQTFLRLIGFHSTGQLFISLSQNIPNLNFYSPCFVDRILWLLTGIMILLYVVDVKICQQRYFKKMVIIVWNAGKNWYTLFNKVIRSANFL